MRFVVYGAGAIGGTIGARLFQQGNDVVLVARGRHFEALRENGLRFLTPDGEAVLAIPAVDHPAAVEWGAGDVAVLAMKGQDTTAAVDALAAAATISTPVVCAQNGVANERTALRLFTKVYGMCVMCPATFLEPGVVEANGAPKTGLLDIGRYPAGSDTFAEEIAGLLEPAGFSAHPLEDVMRWKYRKLLMNLANSVEALCGERAFEPAGRDLVGALRREGEACLSAAGITFASEDEDTARRGDLVKLRPVEGRRRGGGSTWQSLRREMPTVETDYLNGEIALLGRLHGVPTPANALMQEKMRAAVSSRTRPGSVDPAALLAELPG